MSRNESAGTFDGEINQITSAQVFSGMEPHEHMTSKLQQRLKNKVVLDAMILNSERKEQISKIEDSIDEILDAPKSPVIEKLRPDSKRQIKANPMGPILS